MSDWLSAIKGSFAPAPPPPEPLTAGVDALQKWQDAISGKGPSPEDRPSNATAAKTWHAMVEQSAERVVVPK